MYEITIKDTKQPLLIHYVKRSGVEEPIQICLVPELCFLTGLSETQRADFKVMQDVSDFTRLKPTMRQDVFQKFIKSILDNPEAVKYWHDWGLTISPKNLRLQGRLLPPTTLHFGNGYKEAVHGDWGKTATNRPVLTAVALEKWALIYPSNLERSVKSLTTTFQQQAPRLGMTVKPPKIIVLPNDKTELYLKAIRELPDDAQLVMAIFGGSQRADRYAALKKVCCLEKPLASQVIMQKTLANEKRLQSVVQKVALQVNCKLGGQLWGLRIPMPLLMVVGIDVFKNKESGKKFVVGIVASVNDSFGQFYSEVIITDHQGDEMHRSVAQGIFKLWYIIFTATHNHCFFPVLIKAMTAFREVNSGLSPKNMIIYRDGVNSGLLHSAAMEAKTISEEISSKMSNAPKLTFIVVQKRISTKLLHVANWRTDDVENPPAGTVVDHTVTSKGWNDFYLIPMKASLGTVSPTHFTIVMDEANMEADMVQQISYTLTHMYFNWTGNVKVPAPCQYGHKLVELVSSHLHKEPHQNLSRTLYYL
jgi:aubergine-like protein